MLISFSPWHRINLNCSFHQKIWLSSQAAATKIAKKHGSGPMRPRPQGIPTWSDPKISPISRQALGMFRKAGDKKCGCQGGPSDDETFRGFTKDFGLGSKGKNQMGNPLRWVRISYFQRIECLNIKNHWDGLEFVTDHGTRIRWHDSQQILWLKPRWFDPWCAQRLQRNCCKMRT